MGHRLTPLPVVCSIDRVVALTKPLPVVCSIDRVVALTKPLEYRQIFGYKTTVVSAIGKAVLIYR